jgi:hypothetical protein
MEEANTFSSVEVAASKPTCAVIGEVLLSDAEASYINIGTALYN